MRNCQNLLTDFSKQPRLTSAAIFVVVDGCWVLFVYDVAIYYAVIACADDDVRPSGARRRQEVGVESVRFETRPGHSAQASPHHSRSVRVSRHFIGKRVLST